ncbi:hypothetical protein NQ318_010139 [Aromia moschata]|uniref:Uncharacterized protein n=1 Tax=Aromia moschata TaxID=1265417 RepID=A0AAV8Y635_9CUCU|nr:hypothetical protein NQ318_010139 [Aromia moschata]
MVKLTERERIKILCMIGFGDRMLTQKEVVEFLNTVTLGMFVIFLNLVDLQNQKKINLRFCWQYRKIVTQHLANWLLISIRNSDFSVHSS